MIFVDEVGFSLKPSVTRTWAPCGETPLLTAKMNWSKLSTIGAITTTGRFLQHTKEGAIQGPDVVRFFRHILAHVPGKLTVLVDNARIHHTKALRAFVDAEDRLEVEHFPPYSPELNPIELVWAYLKRHVLANFCPGSLLALKSRLQYCWRCVRASKLPDRLLNGPDAFQT